MISYGRQPKSTARRRVYVVLSVLAVFFCIRADACNVPVFRYALERWAAEPYVLRVPPDAPPGQLEALRSHEGANLVIEEKEAGDFELFYPHAWLPNAVVSAPAGELDAQSLIDSPARREVVRRLLEGQSGVWVLIKSGDADKDAAAVSVLGEQIEVANRTLELPDLTDDPMISNPDAASAAGLRVEFSLLEIEPDDAREGVFLRMLMASEPDLIRTPPEPLAFPVFGQGRVLYALLGPGINSYTFMTACEFIIGPCACQIKANNPGFDLLLTADWKSGVGSVALVGGIEAPPLAGTALAGPSAMAMPSPPAEEPSGALRNAAWAVLGLIILVIGATIVVFRRGGRASGA